MRRRRSSALCSIQCGEGGCVHCRRCRRTRAGRPGGESVRLGTGMRGRGRPQRGNRGRQLRRTRRRRGSPTLGAQSVRSRLERRRISWVRVRSRRTLPSSVPCCAQLQIVRRTGTAACPSPRVLTLSPGVLIGQASWPRQGRGLELFHEICKTYTSDFELCSCVARIVKCHKRNLAGAEDAGPKFARRWAPERGRVRRNSQRQPSYGHTGSSSH